MNRPFAAALGLMLAGSLAATIPSYADEPPAGLTITSPSDGEQVGDEVVVTATGPGVPYVLFELKNGYEQVAHHHPVPPGPDGIFTDTLPTKGLSHHFAVVAKACRTASIDSCDYSGPTKYPKRTPLPVVTTGEGWREAIDPTTVGTVPVVVPDTSGIDVFLYTPKGRLAAAPAGPRQIDVAGIRDGYASVGIAQCSDLNPDLCTIRGVTFLVRRAPHASFPWHETFISQNRDGIRETVGYQLVLDPDLPVRARWRVVRGTTTVVGPVDYSAEDVAGARSAGGIELTADPRAVLGRQLAAGSYTFQVEVIPDNVPGYTRRTRVGFPLRVANTPADWRLRLDRPVVYPRDETDAAVPIRLLHGLDADEVRYVDFSYRVVNAAGRMVTETWYSVNSVDQRVAWRGRTYDGKPLPAGRYRFEVRARDGEHERISKSPYFTVSSRRRVYQEVMTAPRRAAKSLIRKSKLKHGRIIRGPYGSIDYIGTAPGYLSPDLRTLHVLRVPRDRIKPAHLRISGSWRGAPWPEVYLIDRHGRRDDVDIWNRLGPGYAELTVHRRFVRPDGTVRFEVGVEENGRTRVRDFRFGYVRRHWVS